MMKVSLGNLELAVTLRDPLDEFGHKKGRERIVGYSEVETEMRRSRKPR